MEKELCLRVLAYLLFGGKGEAHLKREAKVAEFREKVGKASAVIEYSR